MNPKGRKTFPGHGMDTSAFESEVEFVETVSSAEEADVSEFIPDEEEPDETSSNNPDAEVPDNIDKRELLRDAQGNPVKLNGKHVTTPIPQSSISSSKIRMPEWMDFPKMKK